MLIYKVQQLSIGLSTDFYMSFDSIIYSGKKSDHVFAIRNLDGKLETANEQLFLKVMEDRGFVELREHPDPDDFSKYYTFLITRGYAD